jgi:hypothetical protein
MGTCHEFITATTRCSKPAAITELTLGFKKDLCSECALRIYTKAKGKPDGQRQIAKWRRSPLAAPWRGKMPDSKQGRAD